MARGREPGGSRRRERSKECWDEWHWGSTLLPGTQPESSAAACCPEAIPRPSYLRCSTWEPPHVPPADPSARSARREASAPLLAPRPFRWPYQPIRSRRGSQLDRNAPAPPYRGASSAASQRFHARAVLPADGATVTIGKRGHRRTNICHAGPIRPQLIGINKAALPSATPRAKRHEWLRTVAADDPLDRIRT